MQSLDKAQAWQPVADQSGFDHVDTNLLGASQGSFAMDNEKSEALSKVPAITLGFWVIKILATTLGETAGDTVTMSWLGETTPHPVPNGYLIGTAIFGVLLLALVWAQIKARAFSPWLYWATIAASTTAGTTLADFADRSLGIGYAGGSLLLFVCVAASLLAWQRALGSVDVNTIATAKAEAFYWLTITFSQTLGTALGDWVADVGLGYSGDPTGPDVAPLTTVELTGLTFKPLILFGGSVNFPSIQAALTLEDGECSVTGDCGSSN